SGPPRSNGAIQGTPRDPSEMSRPGNSSGTASGSTVLPSPPMTERTAMNHTPGPRFRPFPAADEHTDVSGPHPAAFEGRPLARPAEDVEDQGLAFDVATVVTRRGALGALGAGSVVAVLAACTSGSATTGGASD